MLTPSPGRRTTFKGLGKVNCSSHAVMRGFRRLQGVLGPNSSCAYVFQRISLCQLSRYFIRIMDTRSLIFLNRPHSCFTGISRVYLNRSNQTIIAHLSKLVRLFHALPDYYGPLNTLFVCVLPQLYVSLLCK